MDIASTTPLLAPDFVRSRYYTLDGVYRKSSLAESKLTVIHIRAHLYQVSGYFTRHNSRRVSRSR